MSDTDTQLLTDEAVEEILARHRLASGAFQPYKEVSHSLSDIPALCATVKQLRAERLEVQRALASSVLNDPTEDDDPPYSTTELVGGIRTLIRRKESLLTGVVTQKSQLEQLRAENERLTKERDRAREDVRILTNGRFIQS